MTERTLVGIICSVSVVIICLVSAVFTQKTHRALGAKRWAPYLIVAYGLALGGVACLVKPVLPTTLLDALRRIARPA